MGRKICAEYLIQSANKLENSYILPITQSQHIDLYRYRTNKNKGAPRSPLYSSRELADKYGGSVHAIARSLACSGLPVKMDSLKRRPRYALNDAVKYLRNKGIIK